MENEHSEEIMVSTEVFNNATRPTLTSKELLSLVTESLDCVCVLLAQISESLAILANNTRLIQDKESTEGK